MRTVNYMSQGEADMLNAASQSNQDINLGGKLKYLFGLVGASGTIFYVNGDYGSDVNDGLSWTTAFATIQHAVDSCGNGLGDVIFVAPKQSAKYTENVVIYNHQSIKIIAPWGPWTTRLRVSDAATKYPFTPTGGAAVGGAGFIVLSRDVEICGFAIDNGGAYCGIYCGDGTDVIGLGYTNQNSAGSYFHDNTFIGGTDGEYHIVLQGSSDIVKIKNNVFEGGAAGGAGIFMCDGGSKTNQRTLIKDNEFSGTMNYGIFQTNDLHYSTMVIGNRFSDRLPGTTVMTNSCKFQGASNGSVFAGNIDLTTNGPIGLATDRMSGNTKGYAMNSTVYIEET